MSCTCNLELKKDHQYFNTRYDTDRHRDPWTIATEKYRVETVTTPVL